MIKIVRLVKTCEACPSQWDTWDADGREIYIRYRWGWLTVVRASASKPNDPLGKDAEEIFVSKIGNGFDGDMDESQLEDATQDVLSFVGREA